MEPAAIQNPKIETETGNDSHLIEYENLLDQTIFTICDDILKALILSKSMEWNVFLATYVDPKVNAAKKMDNRTFSFFKSILDPLATKMAANADLNYLLNSEIYIDEDIFDNLGLGFGFPRVKKLISNLDAIDPSIVNDVNAARLS